MVDVVVDPGGAAARDRGGCRRLHGRRGASRRGELGVRPCPAAGRRGQGRGHRPVGPAGARRTGLQRPQQAGRGGRATDIRVRFAPGGSQADPAGGGSQADPAGGGSQADPCRRRPRGRPLPRRLPSRRHAAGGPGRCEHARPRLAELLPGQRADRLRAVHRCLSRLGSLDAGADRPGPHRRHGHDHAGAGADRRPGGRLAQPAPAGPGRRGGHRRQRPAARGPAGAAAGEPGGDRARRRQQPARPGGRHSQHGRGGGARHFVRRASGPQRPLRLHWRRMCRRPDGSGRLLGVAAFGDGAGGRHGTARHVGAAGRAGGRARHGGGPPARKGCYARCPTGGCCCSRSASPGSRWPTPPCSRWRRCRSPARSAAWASW